ncbi:hypothetical protein N9L65_04155 [Candidatus Poseidoniales archaeon]|jgi:hypothetical protein|nr:hypothetical protein [Euryarchaeota archaeon]MDA8673722.1 hypothetical protein [Candidatus Poseidoniales archaeon]MDB0004763.1 hypothetical protein [Candidatus Poseidoniaceae archaeon]MDB2580827.1 hypothetical protein [Candidatus Poseidoniales archaeon]
MVAEDASVETSEESILSSERFWFALDRQLVSSGLRLLLLLPAFSFLTAFGALAYAQTSPNWWAKIEPTLNLSFAMALISLTFVILFGYIITQIIHRHRTHLSIASFQSEVERLNDEHRAVQSLHGYEGLAHHMTSVRTRHTVSLSYAVVSILLLIGIFYINIVTLNGRILLLLSFSFTMLSLGQHMSTRTRPFNMDERTGLLDAYNPPIHPSTLEMVFSDLVKTHMDPLLRSEYEVYSKEIESYILPKIDAQFAREKLLMTLYRHSKGLDFKTMESELGEVLNKKGMDMVREHPVFTMEEWLSIITHVERSCPAFFRMIGRIEEDLGAGRDTTTGDIVFEVDMENVVHERANLFTLMHNLSDEPRTIVLRVQSPDFRPHDLAMTYRLNPGEQRWWSNKSLPLAAEGDEDVLGIMSGLLRDGTMAWQSLLPERFGEATVSVRLEEQSGDLLIGRQINVRVRSKYRERVRASSSITANLVGGLGLVLAVFIKIRDIFDAI